MNDESFYCPSYLSLEVLFECAVRVAWSFQMWKHISEWEQCSLFCTLFVNNRPYEAFQIRTE